MQQTPFGPGVATAIGSTPGTDPAEAARTVVGELPLLPHLPELPARGVGADIIGRTAGLLVDLPVEVVPSGYRVTARPGRDHRRAVDLMRHDLDAIQNAVDAAGAAARAIKVQVAGPWTLTAGIELARGHRVLTDPGALREFTASLLEGLAAHVAEVTARTGAPVVVQLDEPALPAVLAGSLPTPSGYGTVGAVAEPDIREVLTEVIACARELSGSPVVVHCCAAAPPIALLRGAGADALAIDARVGFDAVALDALGEAWDAGTTMLLGLVPATDPGSPLGLRDVAQPALDLVDRLGFGRQLLADRAVPTPSCGLAGASVGWLRRALSLTRDLARAFAEPPESW